MSLEIKPLGLCIIHPAFRDIKLHIDQYNRVYLQYLNSDEYGPRDRVRFQCFKCRGTISYFPNSIGLTCTDNYCHVLWMKNLYKHYHHHHHHHYLIKETTNNKDNNH